MFGIAVFFAQCPIWYATCGSEYEYETECEYYLQVLCNFKRVTFPGPSPVDVPVYNVKRTNIALA